MNGTINPPKPMFDNRAQCGWGRGARDENKIHESLLHSKPIICNMKVHKEAVKIEPNGIKIASREHGEPIARGRGSQSETFPVLRKGQEKETAR